MAEIIDHPAMPAPNTIMGALLRKLHNVQPSADGWRADCPSPDHDGGAVRLDVWFGDDGHPCARCDEGCESDVLADVLFPEPPDEMRERYEQEAEQPAPNPLAALVMPITRALLTERPGPRRYFLTDANSGDGVIVAGTVGLLAAEGGAGKSYSLMQLAISTVTGATWFGPRGWTPRVVGPVLYLAGEEDYAEASRRLHYGAKEAGCNEDDLALLERDLKVLPLAGHGVALTVAADPRSDALPTTSMVNHVQALLAQAMEAGRPYALIIVDPLSRFAGSDVEKDTSAATRFMQVLETFAAPRFGAPTCVCAHHTRKKGENEDPDSADSIRGPSALKDAARWAMRLEPAKYQEGSPDLVTVRMVKRNGVKPVPPLVLCRTGDNEGALRAATRDEVDAHPAVAKSVNAREAKLDEYINRVLAYVSNHAAKTRTELAEAAGRRQEGFAAVRLLLSDGRLLVAPDGTFCTPGSHGSQRFPEPQGDGGERFPVPTPPLKGGGTREPKPRVAGTQRSDHSVPGTVEPEPGQEA